MSIKVERLVNLTIALLETRAPLSLDEIRRRTRYYTDGDPESTRRMFERDKDDLRRLGVPIEVRPIPFSEEQGYLVPRAAYELPDLDLSAEQVAALALAVRLSGESHTPLALAKLAARAPDPAELAADPASTRVTVGADPVDAVADAVVHRTALRFGYRTAAGQAGERTVDPYGVVRRRGAWYLVGRDHDRDALRAFRLDRLTTPARSVGEPGAFPVPADLDVTAAVSGPEVTPVDVTVAVAPAATWAVAVRGGRPTGETHRGRPVYVVPAAHPVRDRSWLLGLGADVEVLAPDAVRDDVVAALAAVHAAHEGSS